MTNHGRDLAIASAELRSRRGGRLLRLGSVATAALAAALAASRAEAHNAAAQDGYVPLNGMQHVASVEQLKDGTVRVTLDNGRQLVLSAEQVSITPDGIFVSPDAVAEIAAGAAAAGGGVSTGLILGGLGVVGVGGLVGLSGGGDSTPPNTAPTINSAASASAAENQALTGLTVQASDAQNDPITYAISGGADAARFTINSSTGVLSFVTPPDFEAPADSNRDNVYEVTVQASDPTHNVTQAVTVTVTNVNDVAPVITSAATKAVAENGAVVQTVTATDVEGGTIQFAIDGGADAARFRIDAATGALTFVAAPDFEAPGDADHNNVYEVVIRASDGVNSSAQTIAVTVTNLNDVAPVIGSAAAVTSAENRLATGLTVSATDVEGDTIRFAIAGGSDAERFAIDAVTGALSFVAAPDYEAPADIDRDNRYQVTVQASDGVNITSQAIVVTVSNVNDVAPVITSNASASVAENSTGTALTIAASDAEGDALRFAITGGADAALFRLDAVSGALAFVTPPDFETPSDADHDRIYQVVVQASDGINVATQTVSITVTNVNDVAPSITSPASASVAENSTGPVLTVAATDPEGDTLAYAIVGGADAARFAINGATGALSFLSPPDFEASADAGRDNGYQVVVQVSDGVHLVTQSVNVTVTNANDLAPVIGSPAAVTVAENLTAVQTVIASDADGDAVRFAITSGTDAGSFAIDATTGALSFVAPPDYEAPTDADHDNRYQVTVQASDGINVTSQAIVVTVANVNDMAPLITSAAAISMPENQLATGLSLAATDADGDSILYSIAGGADAARFTIDPATGALRFVAAPDFEAPADVNRDNRYDVTLQASDGVHAVTQDVAVTVTDLPESPPSLAAALAHDNGRSATDRLTNDAGLAGTVGAPSSMASLTLRVDGATIDVTDLVGADGSFTATEQQIEARLGTALAGGTHDYVLTRTDRAGTTLSQTVQFTLDQTGPAPGTVGLSRSSDTGTAGDGITTAARVALVGSAGEADLDVSASGRRAITDGGGDFTLSDIAIPLGSANVEVIFSDAAGNATAVSLPLTRIAGDGSPDQVLFWNDIAQQVIARSAAAPTYASRALAMQSIAVYDAVSAIDGSTPFWISLAAGAEAGIDAAIAHASYAVLAHLFPSQRTFLDAALARVAGVLGTGATLTQGAALGDAIAEGIIALREHDGYDAFVTFDGGDAPGEWVPTGPAYMLAEAPQWAKLESFALASNDQFRADGPPALDSAEYAVAVNEIKALGSATNSTRTTEQTAIANFWKDGAGTNTPPGHWNDVAAAAATAAGGGVAANARMFAMLNVALADSAVAAWDTKYTYIGWRPETAIQRADEDSNAATIADPNWAPYITSPPHPDYVSGHSTFSGAGAEVLSYLFGGSFSFTVGTEGVAGATRTFSSFWDAAQEAGRSRVYGGIHFEFSNQDGLQIGKSVGDWVIGAFSQTSDTAPPRVTFGPASGLAVKGSFDLTGSVLDNLSGVAGLFYRIDGGAVTSLTYDATGHFKLTVPVAADHSFDGAHSIEMFGVDAAGNIGVPKQFAFSADTRAPVISVTSFAEGAALASGARLTGSLDTGGSAIVALGYAVDGGVVRPLSFNAATGAFDAPLDLAALAIGGHRVVLHATDAAGNDGTRELGFTTATASPFTITSVSIADNASEVGLTQRPQVHFSKAVDPATVTANSFYVTDAAGNKLPANIFVAADGKSAYLFHTGPMPGAQTLRLHVDGAVVKAADGTALDGDSNGTPGGEWLSSFTTVNSTAVAGTTLSGFVVGPGADLLPMTRDDYRGGPDGINHTPDDVFLERIAGAKVYILGHEDQAVYTDANGNFTLTNVPAGNVKLEIDGRTATNAPAGFYFPDMVMDINIRPGVANTVMGTMGTPEQQLNNLDRGEVYLPRVDKAVLIDTPASATTEVTAKGNAYTGLTAAERDMLKLVVTPGSVIGADGQPLTGAQVGISTVPAELVRDMLPPGLLQHTFDITIQAPGASIFAEPLQMTFPNVFDAPPGTKLNFLSFDHTTGRLVIEGTATVSADGLSVVTDPDSGISKPGWHGLTPPGTEATLPAPTQDPTPPEDCDLGQAALKAAGAAWEVGAAIASWAELIAKNNIIVKVAKAFLFADKVKGYYDDVKEVIDFAKRISDKMFSDDGKFDPLSSAAQSMYIAVRNGISLTNKIGDDFAKEKGEINPLGDILDAAEATIDAAIAICEKLKGDPCVEGEAWFDSLYSKALAAKIFTVELHERLDQALPQTDPVSALLHQAEARLSQIEAALKAAGVPIPGDQSLLQILSPELLKILAESVGNPDITPDYIASILSGLEKDSKDISNSFEYSRPDFDDDRAQGVIDNTSKDLIQIDTKIFQDFFPQDSKIYYEFSTDTGIVRGTGTRYSDIKLFAPANTKFTITLYDPEGPFLAQASGTTNASGSATIVGSLDYQGTGKLVDTDRDGIVDAAEWVVGTSINNSDTDGDGLTDLFEIQNGLNPLGNFPAAQGVINSLDLRGEARAIEISADADGRKLALVATGSHGLAIVDIGAPLAPKVLAELDLPGDASDVAVDSATRIAVVATGSGGLQFVDIAVPGDPLLLFTVAGNFDHVVLVDGLVFADDGTALRSFDLATGEPVQSLAIPGDGDIVALAEDGGLVYALTSGGTLKVVEVSNGLMIARGSIDLGNNGFWSSHGSDKMFVGEGVLYIPDGNGQQGGYITVNIANPAAPVLISGPDNAGLAGGDIALNGSGLGLVVGGLLGQFGGAINAVDVVNTTDPQNTGTIVTRYTLPATPTAVAIGAGFAYVTDITGGFHVVNYSGFDVRGVAPTAVITRLPTDVDSATAGIQVLEGQTIGLGARVTDDVQVKQLDVLVNGRVISTDIGYPWDLRIDLPSIAANGSDLVTIQVRATDMGGNIGLSEAVTVHLVPDTIAPTLVAANIANGQLVGQSFRTFSFTFSEALDPDAVTAANFKLVDSHGAVITPSFVQLRDAGRTVKLSFDALPQGQYHFEVNQSAVRDRAGNAAGSGVIERSFSVSTFSVEWINPNGGNWNDAANWSTGRVPGADDDVGILLPDAATVTIHGAARAGTITSNVKLVLAGDGDMTLGGGTLTILENHGLLKLSGDVSVGTLTLDYDNFIFFQNSISGDGDLTVTGHFDWRRGDITGVGKLVIADGADATFGLPRNEDAPGQSASMTLGRTLEVSGDVTLQSARMYTSPNAENVGRLLVLDGGSFTLADAFADIGNTQGFYTQVDVAAGGRLIKIGGGTSSIYNADLSGVLTILDGTIRLEGGGTDYELPAGADARNLVLGEGRMVLAAGAVIERLVVTGGRLEIPAGATIGELVLNGGTVDAESDVQIGTLTFSNGTIQGAGDLSVRDSFTWTGGSMFGQGDTILGEHAQAMIGVPENLDQPGARGYLFMGRHLEIGGTAVVEAVQFYFGANGDIGSIGVGAHGTLDLKGPFSDLYETNPGEASITVATGGVLKKSGGGTSTISGIDIAGTFSMVDGTLSLDGNATYTLPDGAVIDRLMLNGGTLTLAGTATIGELIVKAGTVDLHGTATIAELDLRGGTVQGTGDLIVSDHLAWTGGMMAGTGKALIASGAEAVIGKEIADDEFGSVATAYLGRTLEVAGSVTLERAQFMLGAYDTAARGGTISVLAGGRFDMHGANADIYTIYSTDNRIDVAAGGVFLKSGGGSSMIQNTKINGVLQTSDGVIVIGYGATYTLTAGQNIGHIVIDGGTLILDGAVNIADFEMRNGMVDGAGNLTITHELRWTNGTMTGTGKTTLAAGAQAWLGNGHDPDHPNTGSSLTLGRSFDIFGTATLERGTAYLGTASYNQSTGETTFYDSVVSVKSGGQLHLAGAVSDIYESSDRDNRIEIAAGGTLLKDGGGTSTIHSAIAFTNLGTVTATDGKLDTAAGVFGTLPGVVPPAAVGEVVDPGETLTLATGTHLASLTVSGGKLVLEGNVTIDHLVILSGEVMGAGNLTITDQLDWTGGAMTGTGKTVIAAGADLIAGYTLDADNPQLRGSVQLGRLLEVAGHASVEAVQFILGSVQYDNGFQERYEKGMLSVLSGGSFELKGLNADIYGQPRTNPNDTLFDDSWIKIATGGSFLKSGGGTASIGSVDVQGVVTVSGGNLSIDQRAVYVLRAGETVDHLTINGGTLFVEAGATVRNLTFLSGAIDGPGALTITASLEWSGGEMMGAGKTILADGATALIGVPEDPDQPYVRSTPTLGRVLELAGDARVESASLHLGFYGTDAALGRFVSSEGKISILSGGSLDLSGPFADVSGNYGSGSPPFANSIDVAVGGTLLKTGGGITRIDNVAIAGSFTTIEGTLTIGSGSTYILKAGQSIDGIVLAGGTLVVEGAATIGNLRMQYGTLDLRDDVSIANLQFQGGSVRGDGDLTVTSQVHWTEGSMNGAGRFIVASGADMVLGYDNDADNPYSPFTVQLGRTMDVAGEVFMHRGNLSLDSAEYDGAGRYVISMGAISVRAGGTFELGDPASVIQQTQYNGTGRIDIAAGGSFIKSGGGTSTFSSIDVDGVITIVDGELRIDGDATYTLRAGTSIPKLSLFYSARLIVEDGATIGELVMNGGTLDVSGDASIGVMRLAGGDIIGSGDVTITGDLIVRSAAMTGTGKLIIADGANALFGSIIDPDSPNQRDGIYMGRTLEVAGTLTLEQSDLYLGYNYYNPTTGTSTAFTGHVVIDATGEVHLNGPISDIHQFQPSGGSVRNLGLIIKDDGGTSSIDRGISFQNLGEIRIVHGIFDAPQVTTTPTSLPGFADIFALDGLAGPMLDDGPDSLPAFLKLEVGERRHTDPARIPEDHAEQDAPSVDALRTVGHEFSKWVDDTAFAGLSSHGLGDPAPLAIDLPQYAVAALQRSMDTVGSEPGKIAQLTAMPDHGPAFIHISALMADNFDEANWEGDASNSDLPLTFAAMQGGFAGDDMPWKPPAT